MSIKDVKHQIMLSMMFVILLGAVTGVWVKRQVLGSSEETAVHPRAPQG